MHTGEALGLDPAQLTITVGFDPGFFDERFGPADRRPVLLADLPTFRNDVMDPARSGGDICVQACSNDPQAAFHVVRNFARIGRGVVVMRCWPGAPNLVARRIRMLIESWDNTSLNEQERVPLAVLTRRPPHRSVCSHYDGSVVY